MTTLATRRGYRGKVNRSLCRKKTVRKCRKIRGCKNTKKTAKKSKYCRKRHNKRLVMKGGKYTLPPPSVLKKFSYATMGTEK